MPRPSTNETYGGDEFVKVHLIERLQRILDIGEAFLCLDEFWG